MLKRLLSSTPAEILAYNKEELLESIKLSEGRTIISEVIGEESLLRDVSNAEVAAAFGADILLLNLFDVDNPYFKNIGSGSISELVSKLKRLTARPLGINLEPAVENQDSKNLIELSPGRRASLENIKKVVEADFDLISFTGNPSIGVSNDQILKAVKMTADNFADEIIIAAGKMHMSGINEKYLEFNYISDLITAGADIILLPAPGTVPGIDVDSLQNVIRLIHNRGRLALTAIGTSQESADQETVREIALMSKMAGADIQHIGDGAYGGVAIPENIMALSKTIRGKRHCYRKMAASINS